MDYNATMVPPPTEGAADVPLLAEELALAVWGDDGALPAKPADTWVGWAASALLLADLESADRITVTRQAAVVVDDARLDDELLDAALDVLQAHPTDAARAVFLVTREIPRLADRLGVRLGARGAATPVRRGALMPWRAGWRADPAALDALLRELRGAVARPDTMDRRQALLIGCIAETGQTSLVVPPDVDRAEALPAIAEATARSVLTRVLRHLVQADARRNGLLE